MNVRNNEAQIAELKKTKEKKIEDGTHSLQQHKDRAQAAATWAMAVVHVTLFKSVLDERNNRSSLTYFWPSILLISAAICLQIIVGVLVLVVANTKKFYEQFKENMDGEGRCDCCGAVVMLCSASRRDMHEFDNADEIIRMHETLKGTNNLYAIINYITKKQHVNTHDNITSQLLPLKFKAIKQLISEQPMTSTITDIDKFIRSKPTISSVKLRALETMVSDSPTDLKLTAINKIVGGQASDQRLKDIDMIIGVNPSDPSLRAIKQIITELSPDQKLKAVKTFIATPQPANPTLKKIDRILRSKPTNLKLIAIQNVIGAKPADPKLKKIEKIITAKEPNPLTDIGSVIGDKPADLKLKQIEKIIGENPTEMKFKAIEQIIFGIPANPQVNVIASIVAVKTPAQKFINIKPKIVIKPPNTILTNIAKIIGITPSSPKLNELEQIIDAVQIDLSKLQSFLTDLPPPRTLENEDIITQIQEHDDEITCCGCRRVYRDHDDCLEGWVNVWTVIKTRLEVALAFHDENHTYLTSEQNRLTANIAKNVDLLKTTPANNTVKIKALNDQIKQWESEKAKTINEKKIIENAIKSKKDDMKAISETGTSIEKSYEAVEKERNLKLLSKLQMTINYMLYAILVINAFIAGFGMMPITTNDAN